MNIEQWIEEKQIEAMDLTNNISGQVACKADKLVKVEDLCELLKTHALVPREPTEEQLAEMRKVEYWEYHGDDRTLKDTYISQYKAALAAAEKSQL